MLPWMLLLTTTSNPSIENHCGVNQSSQNLAQAIISHPDQKRSQLNCNSKLAALAQKRAKELATTGPSDITPNEFLIKNDFRIPNYYPIHGNQVEAVAKGSRAIEYLTQDEKHRQHVLGMGEFFSLQTEIGVGHHQDGNPDTPDQWVVFIAEPWQAPTIKFKQAPIKPLNVKTNCGSGWKKSADRDLKRKCKKMEQETKSK